MFFFLLENRSRGFFIKKSLFFCPLSYDSRSQLQLEIHLVQGRSRFRSTSGMSRWNHWRTFSDNGNHYTRSLLNVRRFVEQWWRRNKRESLGCCFHAQTSVRFSSAGFALCKCIRRAARLMGTPYNEAKTRLTLNDVFKPRSHFCTRTDKTRRAQNYFIFSFSSKDDGLTKPTHF